MAYTATMNSFLDALVNKVAYSEVRTKAFQNPIAQFKKESIPLGYSAEFIHVNPATLSDYTPPVAPLYTDPFAAAAPTVYAEYLDVEENKIGSAHIREDEIADAFTSWEKFDSLVQAIVNSLYSANQLFEYNLMKDTISTAVDNGDIVLEDIDEVVSEITGINAILKIKNVVEEMRIPNGTYNTESGAISFVDPENAVIIMRADMKNAIDVYTRAGAYNVGNLDFLPRVVTVDKFDDDDNILAVIMDEAFLQIRDRKFSVDSIRNPADLSINYWLRRRTLSGVIKFAQALALVKEIPDPPTP